MPASAERASQLDPVAQVCAVGAESLSLGRLDCLQSSKNREIREEALTIARSSLVEGGAGLDELHLQGHHMAILVMETRERLFDLGHGLQHALLVTEDALFESRPATINLCCAPASIKDGRRQVTDQIPNPGTKQVTDLPVLKTRAGRQA